MTSLHATRLLAMGFCFFLADTVQAQYVAKQDGDIKIACTCILATAGCQSKVLDALAGKQRVTWIQSASMKKSASYILGQLCYRKRNVDGLGGGLCCEGSNEAESLKLFRGEIWK